jgi:hypothetical protein
VQVTYASYAAAMADLEFAEVTAYGFTSSLPIGASCDCANVGDPYADSESDTVEWPLGSNTWWVQGEYTCYYPPNTGPCAGTIN